MLKPTRIYVGPTLAVIKRRELHGIAHVTGGAFTKLTRLVGGRKLQFVLNDPWSSEVPPIFRFLQREGGLGNADMYRTFNMGVGLCLVTPKSEVEAVVHDYARRGYEATPIGSVKKGEGVLVGTERVA